jgi:hypothetical protein
VGHAGAEGARRLENEFCAHIALAFTRRPEHSSRQTDGHADEEDAESDDENASERSGGTCNDVRNNETIQCADSLGMSLSCASSGAM